MNWGFRTPLPGETRPARCPKTRFGGVRPLLMGLVVPVACALAQAAPAFGAEATIAAQAFGEGNSGPNSVQVTITLDAPAAFGDTVDVETTTGGNASAADFTAFGPTTVTFLAGATTAAVPLTLNGENIFEQDETVELQLSNGTGSIASVPAAPNGTITITNDDDAPTIAINDVTVNEGTVATFTVTRSGNPTEVDVTANFVVNDGTALAASDYVDTSGNISIPAGGPTTATITVTTVNNVIFEGDETFTAVLSAPVGASITTATGTATIDDSADTPSLSLSSFTVVEFGGPQTTFHVTRSGASDIATTVTFSTGGGTATAGNDYTPRTGITVTVPPGGSGSITDVTLDILNETVPVYEGVETIGGTIGAPTNANLGTTNATAAISDAADAPTLTISGLTITEEPSGAQAAFTVTRTGLTNIDATAILTTANGTATATSDYTAVSGALVTIASDGPTAATNVFVTTLNDAPAVFEGNELFSATLSAASDATILTATANATITDVVDTPTLTITGATVTEAGGSQVTFTVTRTGLTNLPATATLDTGTGTATAGDDYTALTNLAINIPAGGAANDQDVTVAILEDPVFEGNETLGATLSGAGNAIIVVPSGTATITDAGDTPTLSVADVSVAEGGNAVFTVTRTGATTLPISATFNVNDGSALAPSDYTDVTGTIAIPAGAPGTDTFAVTTIDNDIFEGNETFTVTLSGPSNAAAGDLNAQGTITDALDTPSVAITDVTVAEGATADFTVSLTKPSTVDVNVSYATANGSATSPADYAAGSGTVTFPAGTNPNQTISVTTVQDTIDEVDQHTFVVNLSNPTGGAQLGDTQGIGTINDDDTAAISISDVTLTAEGNTGLAPATNATFAVTLSTTSDRVIAVSFATTDGTAIAGADYTTTSGTVNFPAGNAGPQNVVVPVRGDLLDEDAEATPSPLADETFNVTLANPTSDAVFADAAAVGTINDDDVTPTLSIFGALLTEGTSPPDAATTPATFAVTLSAPSGLPVEANFATADGTAVSAATATPFADFTAASGTVTIPAGATSPTTPLVIQVAADNVDEPASETFTTTLSAPTNATLATAVGAGTITDDDDLPVITLAPGSTLEGDAGTTPGTVGVVLSNPSAQPITVDFSTANGTAIAPADYTAILAGPPNGRVTVPPLTSSGTAVVQLAGDVLDENDETVLVNFTNASASAQPLAPGAQTTLTIQDNDLPPNVRFTRVRTVPIGQPAQPFNINAAEPFASTESVVEPDGSTTCLLVEVRLTNPVTDSVSNTSGELQPSGRPVTVTWQANVFADPELAPYGTPGTDFVPIAPTPLVFASNINPALSETVKTVCVPVVGDVNVESSESMGIELLSATNATLLPQTRKHLLIIDDETPNQPPFAQADTLTVSRNGQATVNVKSNDFDPNNDPTRIEGNSAPAHGTAACQSTGNCLYIPTPGYSGPDSFNYTLSDGQATTSGTVTITVVNATPVANPDTLVTGQGAPGSVNVLANDSDPDSAGPLTITSAGTATNGTVACGAGVCNYVPRASYVGADQFTYTIRDPDGATAVGTVNVTVAKGTPLTMATKADKARSKVRTRNGYTVTIRNPNGGTVTATSVSVCLPKGFGYVARSVTGPFARVPVRGSCGSGRTKLTWTKRVGIAGKGAVSLKFKVTVGGPPTTARITATARAADGFAVTPLAPAAPIKVSR